MKFISSFVILILSLSSAKIIPPNDHQNWNVLQDDHIWVGWTDVVVIEINNTII